MAEERLIEINKIFSDNTPQKKDFRKKFDSEHKARVKRAPEITQEMIAEAKKEFYSRKAQ